MPDTGKGTHVSSKQEAAVIMAYLRSKSSAKRVKASVGSKTRSSGCGAYQQAETAGKEKQNERLHNGYNEGRI